MQHIGAETFVLTRIDFSRPGKPTDNAFIETFNGSLRDVQALAGHSNLSTTQRYIEPHGEAQRKIVELV